MPWKELTPMQQRSQFIKDLETGLYTMSELCRAYQVSRKTGYKWAKRYVEGGEAGLADRSRRPHSCLHSTSEAAAQALVEARRQHPTWGSRKLLAWLAHRQPELRLPAASTATDILKRHGVVESRRRRRRSQRGPVEPPRVDMTAPNTVWTMDFKGEFKTRDGVYCYPLTVVDGFSRYLLGCHGQSSTSGLEARPILDRWMRQYGLPQAILTDNGAPFATHALCGLSRLSVWWIKLGIQIFHIQAGHPEQNGRHERLHRTLKAETTRPPAMNRRGQQIKFTRFRRYYNEHRPHEALGQRPPAQLYQSSPRPYPRREPKVEYPAHFEVRRISPKGALRWRKSSIFVSEVLQAEPVGLEEIEDGVWDVYFCDQLLGRFDEREDRIHPMGPKVCRKPLDSEVLSRKTLPICLA